MAEKVQKPHLIYDWVLAPSNLNAKYYDVYVRYSFDDQLACFLPSPVLIGCTDGIETKKIHPLNHPKFSKLGTSHLAFSSDVSTEPYLRMSIFPIPDVVIAEVLEYLKQHAPEPSSALDELWRGNEGDSHE